MEQYNLNEYTPFDKQQYHVFFILLGLNNSIRPMQLKLHNIITQKLFNKLVNGYVGNDSAEVTIPTHVWRRDLLHFHIAVTTLQYWFNSHQHYIITTHEQDHFSTTTLQNIVTPAQFNYFIAFSS